MPAEAMPPLEGVSAERPVPDTLSLLRGDGAEGWIHAEPVQHDLAHVTPAFHNLWTQVFEETGIETGALG